LFSLVVAGAPSSAFGRAQPHANRTRRGFFLSRVHASSVLARFASEAPETRARSRRRLAFSARENYCHLDE
jgi:hypothetical protein